MRIYVATACFVFSLLACNNEDTPAKSKSQSTELEELNERKELSLEQERALDLLDVIQTNSEYHLYSTFQGVDYPCTPPDTTLSLSNKEFEAALTEFLNKYYSGIPSEIDALAKDIAMVDTLIVIEHCRSAEGDLPHTNSRNGIWVVRDLCDRRDLFIIW